MSTTPPIRCGPARELAKAGRGLSGTRLQPKKETKKELKSLILSLNREINTLTRHHKQALEKLAAMPGP